MTVTEHTKQARSQACHDEKNTGEHEGLQADSVQQPEGLQTPPHRANIWNLGTYDFRYDFTMFFIYMNSYRS